MRAVRRRIVHTSNGATDRATSVSGPSSVAMSATMSPIWNTGVIHAWTPKIITSWIERASLIERKISSPEERSAW